MKKDDVFYQAMLARDSRFDGKFFVGVKTTGIYCRPICPARPKRENVEFFPTYLAAEKAGYRPCLRCRPESAPQSPAWIGKSAVVQRAVKSLHRQEMANFNEDEFALLFGVSARHLRRLFISEIGRTPQQLVAERRLNLARQLIFETALSMTEIAFAAGFSSLRRFNDAFKIRFKRTPTQIRRFKASSHKDLQIRLSYRPPFDFAGLLYSYMNHRVGDLEWFEGDTMHRLISLNGCTGKISISNDAQKSALVLTIDFADVSMIHTIVARVRAMFDLDSDPLVIANSLELDPAFKKILKKYPGIRLPSGWDPFETAVATILGQLVSVEQGRSLVKALIDIAGSPSGKFHEDSGREIKLFPSPQQILNADLSSLKTTKSRKQTLRDFCQALIEKRISLEPTQDVDDFLDRVMSLRGIGPWTAHYMALKVLRDTDSFPGSDLILARALDLHPREIIDRMSPWRGYAASLMWRHYAQTLKKKSAKEG